MINTEFTVSGMTCGHCANAITEEVSALPEVDKVTVDLESGRMTVTSADPLALSSIADAVEEAGNYTVAEA